MKIFKIIVASHFLIFGFASFIVGGFYSIIAGTLFIILAAYMFPSSHKLITKYVGITNRALKIIAPIVVFFVASFLAGQSVQKTEAKRAKEISLIDSTFAVATKPLLFAGNIDSAIVIAEDFKSKYPDPQKNIAVDFISECNTFQSEAYFLEILADLSDSAYDSVKNGTYSKPFFKDSIMNVTFVSNLIKREQDRKDILEVREEMAKAEAIAYAKERREDELKKQFSAWDGSHRNLEKLVKQAMNDSDSYEHIETVYWDQGDHLIVRTTFSGKNAYNATVKNVVKAKVSNEGEVLEIIEQM
jgi:hypothetical protein